MAQLIKHRITTIVLVLGVALVVGALVPKLQQMHLPNNHQDYAPKQPLEYSHRLHAGELRVPCEYCHSGARRSKHAGIPALATCLGCHRYIPSNFNKFRAEAKAAKKEKRQPRRIVAAEIQKIYDAMGLGPDMKPDPQKTPKAIGWVRVHNLPDFVNFNHSRHVNVGVTCQTCHGPVETMDRVRQFSDLSMGWCVACHRKVNRQGLLGAKVRASTDCGSCHF